MPVSSGICDRPPRRGSSRFIPASYDRDERLERVSGADRRVSTGSCGSASQPTEDLLEFHSTGHAARVTDRSAILTAPTSGRGRPSRGSGGGQADRSCANRSSRECPVFHQLFHGWRVFSFRQKMQRARSPGWRSRPPPSDGSLPCTVRKPSHPATTYS